MNIDKNLLIRISSNVYDIVKKYGLLIVILISLGIFGFLVLKIRTLADREPSSDLILEKSGQAPSTKVDESIAERVRQLQETNVEVRAIFEQSRNNPFQE